MTAPGRTPAVFLTGFMGAGKSTVGSILAEKLGWVFIDLDERIEYKAGKSIADIFAVSEHGEQYHANPGSEWTKYTSGETDFRQFESTVLQSVIRVLNTIVKEIGAPGGMAVALGGGTLIRKDNLELIRKTGAKLIFLDAPVGEMYKRCSSSQAPRPLVQNETGFAELFERRRPAYNLADLRVETSGKTPSQVAGEIVPWLEDSWR